MNGALTGPLLNFLTAQWHRTCALGLSNCLVKADVNTSALYLRGELMTRSGIKVQHQCYAWCKY